MQIDAMERLFASALRLETRFSKSSAATTGFDKDEFCELHEVDRLNSILKGLMISLEDEDGPGTNYDGNAIQVKIDAKLGSAFSDCNRVESDNDPQPIKIEVGYLRNNAAAGPLAVPDTAFCYPVQQHGSNAHSSPPVRIGYGLGPMQQPSPGPGPMQQLPPPLIHPPSILSGHERSTTIMLKNLPSRFTQLLLVEELAVTGFGMCFDFVYVPVDSRTQCCMGYAFVNFTDPRTIVPFLAQWEGRRWPQFSSRKRLELTYGRVQGRDALEAHFRLARTLASSPPHCRPLLFPRQGEEASAGPVTSVVHAAVVYPDPNNIPANLFHSPTCGAFTLYLHGETSRGSIVVRASIGSPTPSNVRASLGPLFLAVSTHVGNGAVQKPYCRRNWQFTRHCAWAGEATEPLDMKIFLVQKSKDSSSAGMTKRLAAEGGEGNIDMKVNQCAALMQAGVSVQ